MIGEFHVAWKDGYLLASPDEGWVAAALANAAIDRGAIPARVDTIALTWATGRAQLRVAPDLPVNALLDLTPAPDSATRSQRLPQIGAPGQRPIFAMAAKDAATLSSLVDLVSGWLEISPTWARRMARIHEKLAEWRTSAEAITLRLERDGPLTVALNSVVRMDAATVPAFALVQQRQRASDAAHPLDALLPNALSLPGNWHGLEGQQTPLLGPALVLCTASDPEYWYAASSEPAMYALTRAAPQESSTPADATVHLDWPALTRNLTPLLRQAVKEGAYLPYNIEDFNRELQPLLQYFETLGSVELTLSNRTEGFEVAGYLDRHAEATP